jgi:hypothetical protein
VIAWAGVTEASLRRDAVVDEPGLVGARWWQDSVSDPVRRRDILLTVLAGVGVAAVGSETCDPRKTSRLRALDLQRKYGWSFGAATQTLVFDGQTTEAFDPARLRTLVNDMSPRVAAHRTYYVQTLFEAADVAGAVRGPEDVTPLRAALRPISTTGMQVAFKRAVDAVEGLAMVPGGAVVVDLDGPESVAFAAGACERFDPVFLFDNWPHPRGVVPAHRTLAAAAYYQPRFARVRATTPEADAPPMFVLDRGRLSPYTDNAAQFDNRWVARLPTARGLEAMGVRRLVYVTPAERDVELDDLNDDFVSYSSFGIGMTKVDAGGIDLERLAEEYVPMPRKTAFSSGKVGGEQLTPAGFGSVPVEVGALSGRLYAVEWAHNFAPVGYGRSGTWNRTGGGWSFGG